MTSTNPTPPDNSRLDRIERILEVVAERQDGLAQRQERTQQQLDQFRGQVSQEFQRQAEEFVSFLSSLAHDLDTLNSNVNAYIAQSTSFLASEQRDRAEFRQQMIGLQTETRNILRELADLRRQQQGNGGANP